MYKEDLLKLHPGHVLERFPNKGRIRVCTTGGTKCEICKKEFDYNGEKAIRHEKGNIYLFWECLDCYIYLFWERLNCYIKEQNEQVQEIKIK